ncbi:MAG: indole-3-glycerol phosphate synthase TrpC [Firmicutes bacterium]|nr:indole-3-glycerol phosphate synthase TrpC [Bacillota bacterium]
MKDILQEILAHKRKEVATLKALMPETEIRRRTEGVMKSGNAVPSMAKALAEGNGIIAEFKRRSPSKGWIREDGRADVIPAAYQRNGAAAISILTDGKFFGGSDGFVREARESGVTLPVLYKDFVIDEYQLFRARLCGASAVLLIAAALPKDACRRLLRTAHSLQLEVLLEMHDEKETEYADEMPDMCGINNRCLGTFVTDVRNSLRLAPLLPTAAVKVSESGIGTPETVRELRAAGFRGFLIGGNFMAAPDPGKALDEFLRKI